MTNYPTDSFFLDSRSTLSIFTPCAHHLSTLPRIKSQLIHRHALPLQLYDSLYLPFFFFSASAFLNGNPLVLLSAPVFLLILPLLLANRMHHSAIADRNADPIVPKLKLKTPVSVHMP